MGRDLHFSFDSLPERYRVQVAQKLSDSHSLKTNRLDSPKGVEGRISPSNAKPGCKRRGKSGSPVRMPKCKVLGPNNTEAQFNRDILLGKGKYEALTLNLPCNVKYTPDWLLEDEGRIFLIEVKGSYHLPTHGRSVMAFKIACASFPMFVFMFAELQSDGRHWRIGTYRDGQEIGSVEGTAAELHDMK